jgi:hypothetical protein
MVEKNNSVRRTAAPWTLDRGVMTRYVQLLGETTRPEEWISPDECTHGIAGCRCTQAVSCLNAPGDQTIHRQATGGEVTMSLAKQLFAWLNSGGCKYVAACGKWKAAQPQSENLGQLTLKTGGPMLAYVRTSNNDRHLWGVTDNRLSELDDSKLPWFLVLIHKRLDEGYFYTPDDVDRSLETWSRGGDGDYKVSTSAQLRLGVHFASINDLCELIGRCARGNPDTPNINPTI